MKNVLLTAVVALTATAASAAAIDPATTAFPWKNGPARDSRYVLAEHPNTVHVFEAYQLSCTYCNQNAAQVAALSQEYSGDERVQFLDLGLDSADRDYQRWINAHNPPYPVVQDVGRSVYNALHQENGVPQTFVVACDGRLVDYTIGYWDNAAKRTLRAAIAEAKETTCE
jgi:hypothetical protein